MIGVDNINANTDNIHNITYVACIISVEVEAAFRGKSNLWKWLMHNDYDYEYEAGNLALANHKPRAQFLFLKIPRGAECDIHLKCQAVNKLLNVV